MYILYTQYRIIYIIYNILYNLCIFILVLVNLFYGLVEACRGGVSQAVHISFLHGTFMGLLLLWKVV